MTEPDRLAWNFDDPASTPRPARGLQKTVLTAVFIVGGLAAVALLIVSISLALNAPAGQQAMPAPTSTPTLAAPSATATESAPPSRLPSECSGLYSESMTSTLEQMGFELGSDYEGPWQSGSADTELRELLDAPGLDCYWTDGEDALLTRVAEVGSHVQSVAVARLGELGFSELSENGGVRYVLEDETATGTNGESHFFRDGLWFATHWRGHGQYGYTADMILAVFG